MLNRGQFLSGLIVLNPEKISCFLEMLDRLKKHLKTPFSQGPNIGLLGGQLILNSAHCALNCI